MTETNYEKWARTQKYGGLKAQRITAFRDLVAKLDRKQLNGGRLYAEDYVQLALLAGRMYRQGDHYAMPEEVIAATQLVLDADGHEVSTG